MPEPTKIPRPFADSGDKNSIPDSSGGLGFASWREGFPAITGTPFAQGGVAPKRADFNGVFNALSAAAVWAQQGGVYAYDATTDYEVGNVVLYSGDLYKCITANGPSSAVKAPTDDTVWSKVILSNATQNAAGYMGANDKVKLDNLASEWASINFANVSVPSGVTTKLGEFTAPSAGKYLFILPVTYSDNSTGVRRFHVSNAPDTSHQNRYQHLTIPPASGFTTAVQFIYSDILAQNQKLYFNLTQTSGSTLICNGGCMYIKVSA